MVRRFTLAWLALALLTGTAWAEPTTRTWAWGAAPGVPERVLAPLTRCAPAAVEANGRFAIAVSPTRTGGPVFTAFMKEQQTERGVLLDYQYDGKRETLHVSLVDQQGKTLREQTEILGRGEHSPCDAAARAAWYLDRKPLNPASVKLLGGAREYWRDGRYEEANENYRRIVAIDIHAYAESREAGDMWRQAGRDDVALVWYQDAIRRNRHDFEAYLRLARLYGDARQEEDQRQAYEQALAIGPRPPALLAEVARFYAATGRLVEAQALWTEAAQRAPWDGEIIVEVWQIAERNGDYAAAAWALERILEMGGDDSHRRLLAHYLLRNGNYPRAETELKGLRDRYPADAQLRQDYVTLLVETGRYDEALPILHAQLEQRGDTLWALETAGRIYYRKRQFQTAIPLLERAANLAPADESVEQLLTKAIEFSGDKSLAFAHLEKSLFDSAALSTARLQRYASLAVELAETERALRTLRRLAAAKRSRTDRRLVNIIRAGLLERLGRREEALAVYEQLLTRRHREPRLLFELGRLRFAAGRTDAALVAMRELSYSTQDGKLLLTAAALCKHHEQGEAALDLYRAARLANPDDPLDGLLYLENLLLRGVDDDNDRLVYELHQSVQQEDQRELLLWLQLYHYRRTGREKEYRELLPFVLRFVASRETTRVELSEWPAAVREHFDGEAAIELLALIEVFSRRQDPKTFAKQRNLKVPGW
ncbi:MAG: tetratricopeptide repeat protein [Candidatus Lernaella stagnicola]|nr:tetratricopeptide repeat protein [Candidatus Lernaella stagnicola]